jgi:hypothetical protein
MGSSAHVGLLQEGWATRSVGLLLGGKIGTMQVAWSFRLDAPHKLILRLKTTMIWESQ